MTEALSIAAAFAAAAAPVLARAARRIRCVLLHPWLRAHTPDRVILLWCGRCGAWERWLPWLGEPEIRAEVGRLPAAKIVRAAPRRPRPGPLDRG